MLDGISIIDYIRTLPDDYIVEVYDDNHNVAYHGRVDRVSLNFRRSERRNPVKSIKTEKFIGIDGEPGTRVLINASRAKKLNSSVQSGLVDKVLDAIEQKVIGDGGVSAAYIAADLDMEEQLDLIVMLAQATGKYTIYATANGYFQDEDYIITKTGITVNSILEKLGMSDPGDLKKI